MHHALAREYGARIQPARSSKPVLDTLVACILSQNTTNTNSHAAMENIRRDFPMQGKKALVDWAKVRVAQPARLEATIRVGGLAKTKASRIRVILQQLRKSRGREEMDYLRGMDRAAALEELSKFKGIGPKTASIVVMFALGLPDFAVDTHVYRYALQLGWVPSADERAAQHREEVAPKWPQVTRDTAYTHLNAVMPDQIKYSMHLILTDTRNGLPVDSPARRTLGFNRKSGVVAVDGKRLSVLRAEASSSGEGGGAQPPRKRQLAGAGQGGAPGKRRHLSIS